MWRSLSVSKPTAIAMGNFDGVHLGHRCILKSLCDEAARLDLTPMALTFEPHPRAYFFPEKRTVLLTSPREKNELLLSFGIEVITLQFDASIAVLEAEDFVREVLRTQLKSECIFLGPDHRFGKNARGNAALLRSLYPSSQNVFEAKPFLAPDSEIISSSSIRKHLEEGRIDKANKMLGRNYTLSGMVVSGEGRGRQLGFPTANLNLEDARKALPAYGVYGGRATVDGETFSAIANVGYRPTFGRALTPSVEVHLLGVNRDCYGKFMEFETVKHIRPEKSFSTFEALKLQISEDIAQWNTFFKAGDSL